MNNSQLNDYLRTVPIPEQPQDYWDELPLRVMVEIERRGKESFRLSPAAQPWWAAVYANPLLSAAVAVTCLLLAFVLGNWHGGDSPVRERQLAEAQKCFREIGSLFPNQVQALIFDAQGVHLVLAENAEVPTSTPLYITISDPSGVHRFVTFSGQRIGVNGDTFEVLVDCQGDVLVLGEQWVWSSSMPDEKSGQYRIAARSLPMT